jgi:hypothetical protein
LYTPSIHDLEYSQHYFLPLNHLRQNLNHCHFHYHLALGDVQKLCENQLKIGQPLNQSEAVLTIGAGKVYAGKNPADAGLMVMPHCEIEKLLKSGRGEVCERSPEN